ncbi:MAG TPA: diguanylate cyclase [Solirubrobacteraceae bacterium]|nr:diguanylate cyclase [Solirubrobacteraceae bacterium]
MTLWALAWFFVLAYAASLITGLGGESLPLVLLMLAHALGAVGALLGAVVSRGARRVWALLAVATIAFMTTATVYAVVPDAAGAFPSIYDTGLFAFYPTALVALVLWLRHRLPHIRITVWLDAAIGALVLPAIAAAAIAPLTGDHPAPIVTGQLLYALGDLALLGFLASAYLLTSWRPGRNLLVLMAGAATLALGDIMYVIDVAAGGSSPSVLSAVCWPVGLLFFSAAGWQPVSPLRARRAHWAGVGIPSVAAIACLPLAVFSASGSAATLLAGLALALAILRLVLSLTENARLLSVMSRSAVTDSLTGLANHRAFHEVLDRRLREEPDLAFAVVLFDVDGFKCVNDDHGHAEGDRLLREVAHALRASIRAEDCVARLGGDEFGVLVPEAGTPFAVIIGQRVQRAVDALDAGVTISFGVAEWPTDGPTKEQLLFRADMALYQAKPEGADRRRLKAAAGVAAASASHGDPQASGADRVSRVLAAARAQLGMEIAYFSEFADGEQVIRRVEGDAESFGLEPGAGIALEDTYCQRVVDGQLPSIIRDTQADPRVSSLDVTSDASLGAYVGVPVRLSDGRLYGTLCCASHSAAPALAERDVEFMHVLARLLGEQLESDEREAHELALQTQALSLRGLLAALNARDRYTGEHSEQVVELSRLVARHLGLSDDEIREVEQLALLHDIGKIGVPDAVLRKQGPLSDDEWRLMREHPAIGARLVAAIDPLVHLAAMIRAEHERWDGGGYPDGLAGSDIPLASRVVFACDAYHAMTSDRPYRPAMPLAAARRELEQNAGTQFDPEVVNVLLRVLDQQGETMNARDRVVS